MKKQIIISEKEFLEDKKLSDEKSFLKLFSHISIFFIEDYLIVQMISYHLDHL